MHSEGTQYGAADYELGNEVNDDWYAAHRIEDKVHTEVSPDALVYLADETTSVLGCKFLMQMCDLSLPSETRCSPFTGNIADIPPSFGKEASNLAPWVIESAYGLWAVLAHLKSTALTSRNRVYGALQGPLPDNQWQIEVENWHNIFKATLQGSAVESAVGPSDPGTLKYFWHPATSEQRQQFCKNQKIHSTAHTNFSVLQLSIVLILGGLIIIIGLTLEDLVFWIDKRRKVVKHSRLEWSTNDVLQTQRLAHEELGIGPWKECAGARSVPVLVEKGQLLAVLNLSNPMHPILQDPKQEAQGGNSTLDSVPSGDVASQDDTVHSETNDGADNLGSVSSTESQRINTDSEIRRNTATAEMQQSTNDAETAEGGLSGAIDAGDFALISSIISLEQDFGQIGADEVVTDAESPKRSSADSNHGNIDNAAEDCNSPTRSG
ncbi:MAG: hypothetical protein Q9160_006239 [Pyrenula sp. 1 TL-2023]